MGYGNMMYYGGHSGPDILTLLFSLVILADLILLGWWLWKQIQK